MERIIYLQKFGKIDQSLLINLKSQLERELNEYNVEVKIIKDLLYLTDSEYNKSKGKFDASKIIKLLKEIFSNKDFFRILGILDKDIYSKNHNFVFGLASMKSGVALISLTRLREKFYKETNILYRKHETKNDIQDRILKEAIHELGHTFGLKHCNNSCVMQFSDSLKEIDKKILEFCDSCLILVKLAFK
ncbi:MAG: archaemetzincin family Zn-dependent metalloprotease [Promethearchaeota archaeon]|jgi:archaemetzincin